MRVGRRATAGARGRAVAFAVAIVACCSCRRSREPGSCLVFRPNAGAGARSIDHALRATRAKRRLDAGGCGLHATPDRGCGSLFFLLMAAVSTALAVSGAHAAWVWFTAVGNYLCVAALFAVEYAYRRRRFPRDDHVSPRQQMALLRAALREREPLTRRPVAIIAHAAPVARLRRRIRRCFSTGAGGCSAGDVLCRGGCHFRPVAARALRVQPLRRTSGIPSCERRRAAGRTHAGAAAQPARAHSGRIARRLSRQLLPGRYARRRNRCQRQSRSRCGRNSMPSPIPDAVAAADDPRGACRGDPVHVRVDRRTAAACQDCGRRCAMARRRCSARSARRRAARPSWARCRRSICSDSRRR